MATQTFKINKTSQKLKTKALQILSISLQDLDLHKLIYDNIKTKQDQIEHKFILKCKAIKLKHIEKTQKTSVPRCHRR